MSMYDSSDSPTINLFRFYESPTLPILGLCRVYDSSGSTILAIFRFSILRLFRFYVSSASTTLPILRLLDCFAKAKTQHAVLRKLQLLLTDVARLQPFFSPTVWLTHNISTPCRKNTHPSTTNHFKTRGRPEKAA